MHYPALLLEHFDEPRNAGELPAGEGHELHGSAGSEAEGAWVRFALRVHQGRIAAIRFRALGSPWLIAACSLATEMLGGQPVTALAEPLAARLAATLQAPPERLGGLLRIEDALRNCQQAWENSELNRPRGGVE